MPEKSSASGARAYNHMVMHRTAALALALASLAGGGCASRYGYAFHLTDPGALPGTQAGSAGALERLEGHDVDAELQVDLRGAQAIVLSLRNKTEQVVQVRWADVLLVAPGGATRAPRPDVDLGWINPGETQTARLIPFALPVRGGAALAYEGKVFELQVPMLVRRELVVARYHLAAHVEELK